MQNRTLLAFLAGERVASVVISVLADNGGTSTIGAIWNEADLISDTLTAGSYTAHYGAPLLADLDPTFRTDALGVLDRAVFLAGIFGLNSDSFGVGGNAYLFDDVFLNYFGNPAILTDPLSDRRLDLWSGPTAVPVAVPEPAAPCCLHWVHWLLQRLDRGHLTRVRINWASQIPFFSRRVLPGTCRERGAAGREALRGIKRASLCGGP